MLTKTKGKKANAVDDSNLGPFRNVPYMGVIYVVAEAMKLGYHSDNTDWCNLGQGMPEVGVLPHAPERVSKIEINIRDHAYGPVSGITELREAVAKLYNQLFRKGKKSQYGVENVAISAGGRLGLTRAIWALDRPRLGYFTPDYTAYEDLIGGIPRINHVHIELSPENGFVISTDELKRVVSKNKLDSLLISNPCNPTGCVISGSELASWVSLAREKNIAVLFDEFYSHYVWNGQAPVSVAKYIDDVNKDPVIMFDGLTKNYRYPGWRVGWTLGPKRWIENLTCSGSALDGGPSRWEQKAVVSMIEPKRAYQETEAMRKAFRPKRDLMYKELQKMGVEFKSEPNGTFYCWGSVAKLPAPLNDGFEFFRKALKHRVITVPGEFFDVNPSKKRVGKSPLKQYVRFSFGAPMPVVKTGLARLAQMVKSS